MKNFIKPIVVFATFFLSFQVQAQKIGHISLDSLLSIMPESKTAKQTQADYYKQLEGTIVSMQTELQTKYKDYQDNETKYNDLIKQTKQKELNDLNQRIQDFQTSAQADLQKKNDELTKPIFDKARKAIEQVAKENGYKYIIDSSGGDLLYSEPSDDIMGLVVKKLAITVTPGVKTDIPKTPVNDPKKPK